jgi:6-phosphofructokinase
MDNDARNTEYCIGFSTAITRAMEAIDQERTTIGSRVWRALYKTVLSSKP